MKLRRYCITVMDNWTPTREFFTLHGALRFRIKHPAELTHLWKWDDGRWVELDAYAVLNLLPFAG